MAAIPNAELIVEITDPASVTTKIPITTDIDGNFTTSFTPTMIGSYALEVEFEGDANFVGTETTIIIIVIAGEPTPTTFALTGPTEPVFQGSVVTINGVLSTLV